MLNITLRQNLLTSSLLQKAVICTTNCKTIGSEGSIEQHHQQAP